MSIKLERLSAEERIKLCRTYFYIGFALLPLIWLVNAVWFYPYIKVRISATMSERDQILSFDPDEQKKLRFYVISSAIGFIVWSLVFVSWIATYQISRSSGNSPWAEWLTFITPLGYI